MQHKKTIYARKCFAFMVPLTVLAFIMGSFTDPNMISLSGLEIYDYAALVIASIGVFFYNWYEEKPQKASIETL